MACDESDSLGSSGIAAPEDERTPALPLASSKIPLEPGLRSREA